MRSFELLAITCVSLCVTAATVMAAEPVNNHPRLMFRTTAWESAPSPSEIAVRVDRMPYARWFGRLGNEDFHTGALYWLILNERGETSQAAAVADSVIARMLALPEGSGNFFYGENLQRMSLAWDWLYDDIPEAERADPDEAVEPCRDEDRRHEG